MTDKNKIKTLINQFSDANLKANAVDFFASLGYSSSRTQNKSVAEMFKYQHDEILDSAFLFQLAEDNLSGVQAVSEPVYDTVIESYLFVAIELRKSFYSRTKLVEITRELNKKSSNQPVLILFKHGETITFSVINRRVDKKNNDKDVIENKVSVLKDIRISNPHSGHLKILENFSFSNLKPVPKNFVELHNAWLNVLNLKLLNEQFYEKLFHWYLYALSHVKFPQIRHEADLIPNIKHQSESLIRLLTRLLFVWFMKEKGLVNAELFEQQNLKTILKNFTDSNSDDSIFYKAILQNLFFATLNMPIEKRKVIDAGNCLNKKEYGEQLVYRYAELFNDNNFEKHFANIPFLNGGLFDCLDQRKTDETLEIRLDGFSTSKSKQAVVPDKLFFGEYPHIDLSQYFEKNKAKKSNVTVYGLIQILQDYKFTIEENTPLEEDVALDPELLGKVFENLLAAYDEDTGKNARNYSGSFYTPREIVDYMVDESLKAYFKSKLEHLTTEQLDDLLSYTKPTPEFSEQDKTAFIEAIDNLKILDPACGSGAFPMGVLHKLVFVLSKLDPDNKAWRELQKTKATNETKTAFDLGNHQEREMRLKEINDSFDYNASDYGRKLYLIENCIHGVDIQPIATQISKLRFFISLIVDQQRHGDKSNNFGIRPLPNLDFKIVAANTLIAAPKADFDGSGLGKFTDDNFFTDFSSFTHEYFKVANPEEKKKLRIKIERLIKDKCDEKIKAIESLSSNSDEKFKAVLKARNKKQIDTAENDKKLWQSYGNLFKHEAVKFFEPRYFFPQILDGFDIVIGNPPYGASFTKEEKIYLQNQYPIIKGQPESYEYFIYLSIDKLILNGGFLSFINPTNFIEFKRAEKLREFILLSGNIKTICNFRFNVWSNNAAETLIFNFVKDKNLNELTKVLHPKNLDDFSKNRDQSLIDQKIWIGKFACRFLIRSANEFIDKIEECCLKLSEICEISQGIIVYKTREDSAKNLYINSTFVTGWKKLLDGKSKVEQYKIEWGGNYLNYGKWLWCAREEKFFNQPKIVFIRLRNKSLAKKLIGSYDENCFYNRDNFNNIIQKDKNYDLKYILALFNSKLINYWYKSHFDNVNINPEQVKQIPIKKISESEQQPFVQLVDYILFIKKQPFYTSTDLNFAEERLMSNFFENLIDALVYELYFPEELHEAKKQFMSLVVQENLPDLNAIEGDKVGALKQIVRRLTDKNHPLYNNLFFLDSVPVVRIIEGKA